MLKSDNCWRLGETILKCQIFYTCTEQHENYQLTVVDMYSFFVVYWNQVQLFEQRKLYHLDL